MESLIDKLSIGSRDVTRIDESAYVLPQRQHAALYQQLDEDMRNGASNAADHIHTVIKDSIMVEEHSSCRNNQGRKSKASQKKATRLHKRQSVAWKRTDGIKASLSCNNIKKRKERSLRKQIKEKANARVQKKRRTKQDIKSMSKSLATFKLR